MSSVRIIFAVALVVVAGCRNPPPLDEPEKRILSDEIRSMLGQYFDGIRSGGLKEEFKYLDNSDDFFWVPPGYTSALSFDSVRTILESHALEFRSWDFTWESLRVIPLERTAGAYTGIIAGTMTMHSGKTVSSRMIETGVVVRRGGTWKILCGQSRILEG